MRPRYRIRQFWQALVAGAGPAAPSLLGPGLQELFVRMPPVDRDHGRRTCLLLANAEGRPADLLIAALLHDVGKSRPEIHLWDRILFVLASRLAPAWLQRLASGSQPALWAGLLALEDHAEQGALLVAAAGASRRTVELIRYHHTAAAALAWPDGERQLLEALQRADESS